VSEDPHVADAERRPVPGQDPVELASPGSAGADPDADHAVGREVQQAAGSVLAAARLELEADDGDVAVKFGG